MTNGHDYETSQTWRQVPFPAWSKIHPEHPGKGSARLPGKAAFGQLRVDELKLGWGKQTNILLAWFAAANTVVGGGGKGILEPELSLRSTPAGPLHRQ
ncbi:uncharacterized protein PADG_11785 [Paracoccidioides brasiliensis Pb18]|uniref:Uncharacterized protein n=1 Tax=Paracoccidioides brasiliensis (strain Pb18) TaxID=502780 RepID=A0A0A0HUG8_PARBD|nr:uncharacterized protein PADG_11785 [Paracoccidioides brasiliensis Pb18]KGM91998.1 hypothetical protein PADG_11785 [Paracoccidioides brasiliensis Pb18]